MSDAMRVAMLGCGTVGSQVVRLLDEQSGDLAARVGVPLEIAGIAVRRPARHRDVPADLLTTPWGRVLLVKAGLVAAVAVMGYVNNRYAVPALDAWAPGSARVLRRTVTAEAAVMIVVVLVTAVLVVSQT